MSLLHKTPCHAQHTLCISLDSHIVLPHPASVGCIECRTGPWRRAKQGMHLWPVLYDCPCTYSFLHDFASICRNAPFYQIAISSRFSPSEQSPGSYQHPLPWQILQPGSPGQCKLHDFTANEPGKMPTISKQCSSVTILNVPVWVPEAPLPAALL